MWKSTGVRITSRRIRIRVNDMATSGIQSRLRKLKVLSERGSPGEKENAKALLDKMCLKYGVTLDQVESSDAKEMRRFHHKRSAMFGHKLLAQCIYKVMGENTKTYTRGKNNEIWIECTAAQAIELELDFEFYSNLLEADLKRFYSMFVQKNNIFPPNCKVAETDRKITRTDIALYEGITRQTRTLKIEGTKERLQ